MNPPIKILIVDDEAPARSRLRHLLADIAGQVPHICVGEAEQPMQAIQLFQELRPDVVLLDIHMPGMSGIECARHLLQLSQIQAGANTQMQMREPCIIFITAFDDYALQAFEVHALDYLVKPVRAQRLQEALQRAQVRVQPSTAQTTTGQALQQIAPHRTHLSIQERGRVLLVPLQEVIYFKAELKYITVRTRDREYLMEESLVSLEQEFAQQFIRIHRNALIARQAILGFERVSHSTLEAEEASFLQANQQTTAASASEPHWEVVLRDIPERLPISRRQWGQVKALVK